VGLGLVPESCAATMACRYQEGTFRLPIKYGYDLVGVGCAGALQGQRVFVLHPHQGIVHIEDAHALSLPDWLPSPRATLIPNLETALNATWDADLADGDRCVVVGGGMVGVLVAFVLWRTRGVAVRVIEIDPERAEFLEPLPWVESAGASTAADDGAFDVAFHCSGAPEGLRCALRRLSFEGRVVELSWYGERPVTLELGTHFHFQRQRIVSSQVGAVARSQRGTTTLRERLQATVALLDDTRLDGLLEAPVAFAELPRVMAAIYRGQRPRRQVVVGYGELPEGVRAPPRP
jgi:threonine dehydrogenase-like Zn-dependent dehydrogenase